MLTVMSRLGRGGLGGYRRGCTWKQRKLYLRAATTLPRILGEVSTSLGLACLSGKRTRDVLLLPSPSPCSSLQTGGCSRLDVFTRATWIWLSEKLEKDVIFKTGNTLYSPKFQKAALDSGKSSLMLKWKAPQRWYFLHFFQTNNWLHSARMKTAQIWHVYLRSLQGLKGRQSRHG